MRRAAAAAMGLVVAAGLAVAVAQESPQAPPPAAGLDERGWTVAPGALAEGMPAVLTGGGPFAAPVLDVALVSTKAEAVDLDDVVTQPTFLFYFSATCSHCLAVAPEVTRMAARLAPDVAVVGIASGSNSLSEVRAFAEQFGIEFPMYKDITRTFASKNKATSTPTVWLVRPAEGAGFETLAEFRPFGSGASLPAEIRARVVLGQDPFSAFEEGRYYGARACGSCHIQEFGSWGLTHHSTAYWTLYERERAEDTECVGCHVTGWEQPGGFVAGDHGSALVDVGCEACHGPAGPHAGARQPVSTARDTCVGCHDADHSIRFTVDKGLPFIDHWRAAPMDDATFRIAREDLLEGRAGKPLLAFPPGQNLGVAACKECHSGQVARWKKGGHARAFKTLKGKGSHKDVGCVSCHAVESAAPAEGVDDYHVGDGVGCEACHGPGEQHVAAGGGTENIVGLGESCPECVIEAICTRCHTPEQDPDWELSAALKASAH